MRGFLRLIVLLRSWFRAGDMDTEFQDELGFHLERQIQANLDAGMTLSEAQRAAHLSLGHVEGLREESRAARPGALARRTIRDIAYGARLLRKAPAFATTAVVIVAIGIGATTAIFSVVYGIALRPLPYRDPDRLVSLWTRYPQLGSGRVQVNAADHREWQASNHVFAGEIGLVRAIANFNLTGDGEPERLFGARVSSSLFRVLGVAPVIGRRFTDGENENGRDRVALLSDGLWKRRFGGDRSIVGRTITLSGVPHLVVGVMGPDFQYPGRDTQIWTPLTISPDELSRKEPGNNYLAIARLKPGVSLAQARGDMDAIGRRLAVAFPAVGATGIEVIPLLEDAVGAVRPALFVLLGAVSSLLLIACLNLANLLGARAASRSREFALRLAMGASRVRLALQAVAEVVPVLILGGILGVSAAAWGIAAFVPLAPASLPRAESIAISVPVLLFSAAMLATTGIIGGLLPAAQAWRSDLMSATREATRSTAGGPGQTQARDMLVVTQIALVLPLLVGSGLLVRSFSALVQVDPGFRPNNIASLHVAIPRSKYPNDADVTAFCTRLVEGVAQVPGVASLGMVNRLPLAGVGQVNLLEFDSPDPVKQTVSSDTRSVTPDYFRTMDIPLIEGRFFANQGADAATTATRFGPLPTSGIIDERIARTFWPGQSALGKRFRFALGGTPWMEVVGVVGHVHHDGLDVDPRPQVYFNYLQRAQDRMVLVVRGSQDVRALTPAIVQAIREVDPEQPVYDVRTMEDVVERSTAQRWLNMTLVTTFAVIALLLASVGVYGVIAYGVTRQTREFGIRIALGARPADVTWLVLRRGVILATGGVAIGVTAALLLTRAMQGLLFGVRSSDTVSFAVAGAMLAVALLASYLPARRAASVDPAITLRGE